MAIFRRRKDGDERADVPVTTAPAQGIPFWPHYGNADIPWVTSDQALGVPALWRGINMIANAVATASPPDVFEGDERVDTPLSIAQPSPEQGTFDFYHATVVQVLVTGNALFLPLDYVDGVPQQLLAVPEHAWIVKYSDDGRLVYTIAGQDMSSDQVIHIRGFTRTGDPKGVGIVTAFRKAIGYTLSETDSATSSGIPSGVLTIDTKELTPEQAATTKTQWMEKFNSAARTPAVLPNSIKFEPIQFNPRDRQWIEGRALSIAEAAFMLNLDPTDLGASIAGGGSALTYANVESRAVDRIVQTYGPIGRRIEEAFGTLLPAGQVCRLNWERLLRMDSTTRAAFYKTMHEIGAFSTEYIQTLEKVPAEYRTTTEEAA